MGDIQEKLKQIIIKNSKKAISENDITEASSLTADFGFDSVQVVEMIVDIETEFDITLDDDDVGLDVLTKYNSLRELIVKKLAIKPVAK